MRISLSNPVKENKELLLSSIKLIVALKIASGLLLGAMSITIDTILDA